ncbi:MAG TPA: SDR family NAD(P)-dependent oxidoreductase [Kofleriaceae bacterium]|nr:SDR family NAD(P)-dependent oxidoreductase [Kofleriaceae bacterium]
MTGASSGLGRATAIAFARQGCAVVLAARRDDALEATAALCRAAGGDALVVPTDVTVEAEVAHLVDTTLATWGQIDVWVNNAGVTLYALLEDAPLALHRQVLEVNLLGAIICARAVVPVFRRAHRGVLIEVSSVLGGVGQAFVPSYVISKFGVHGLAEALRVELADEPDIHVCTVFPYAIDTPHFEAAGDQIGRAAHALPPVQDPARVADAIVGLARRPRRTRYVPRWMALGLVLHALAPRTTERLLLDALRRWHLTDERTHIGAGNLFHPGDEPAATRGHRGPKLGMAKFTAWLLGRLVRNELEAVGRFARRVLGGPARLAGGQE